MFEKIIICLIITLNFLFIFPLNSSIARVCLTKTTDISRLDFQKDSITNYPINIWVHTDDTPVFDCFLKEKNLINRLEITSRYKVVRHNFRIRKDRQYWSLLVEGDAEAVTKDTIIGWVSHEYLLTSRSPMKHQDSGIYQKALIKEADANNGRALLVYTHPGKNLFRNNKLGFQEGIEVRTVFYVYDYYPKKARAPESLDAKRILIGADDSLDTSRKKAHLLIGWVDRNKVSFWNSRLACDFKMGTIGKITDDYGNIVFQTNKIDTPLKYDELRNPILEKKKNKYKIGAFARLSRQQLGFKRKITNIQTGLEILFVIDTTWRMFEYYQYILQTVKQLTHELESKAKDSGLSIPRFGLVLYRNYNDNSLKNDKPDDYLKIINFEEEYICYPMTSIRKFTQLLKNENAFEKDKTIEASMYKSLIEGLQKCRFDTGSRGLPRKTRIVIHVGVAKDNGRGNYSPDDVSRALHKHHIFKYFSINADSQLSYFSESVQDISIGVGRTIHLKNNSDFFKINKEILLSSQKKSKEIKDQIQIVSRGFAGDTSGRIGVVSDEILKYAKMIIVANNIDPDSFDGFKQYVEGWINKDLIDEYVLVSMSDIEYILTFLNDLTNEFDSVIKRRRAWEQTLRIILGDQSCILDGVPITLDSCNRLRNGIPIKAGFMRYTVREFLNLNSQDALKVSCEARMALEQFRAFMQNKYIKNFNLINISDCNFHPKYDHDLNNDGKVISPFSKNYGLVDKYYFKEGNESVAWIPLRHLDVTAEIK